MTRENKLALVVGFGLLLLVGILVSDHFSPARVEAAGDLRAGSDPSAASETTTWKPAIPATTGGEDPATNGQADADSVVLRPSAGPGPGPGERPEQDPPIIQNDNRSDSGRGRADSPASGDDGGSGVLAGTMHEVVPGDTLEGITVGHYGDRSLIPALARHNRITDPSTIRLGQRIELPPAAVLRGETVPATTPSRTPAPAAPATSTPAGTWFYLVKKNDTLSEIAAAELGRTDDWKIIHAMNRDVIPRTTDLRAGQRLRMPSRRR